MSSVKSVIKYALGHIRCKLNHLEPSQNVYIGKGVNIVGGVSIKLNDDVIIRPYVDLWSNGGDIEVGHGTEIGERCRISISHSLKIGDDVLFSPNVYVTDCDHEYRNVGIPVIKQGVVKKDNKVEICEGAYIGINAVIVGNVRIGKGSVVGANSVVTKDVPDYCVAVGSPAHVIKRYYEKTHQWEKEELITIEDI